MSFLRHAHVSNGCFHLTGLFSLSYTMMFGFATHSLRCRREWGERSSAVLGKVYQWRDKSPSRTAGVTH